MGENINILTFLALVAASWIIGTFSFLPGGIGVREVVFALLLFQIYGIPEDIGLSMAFTYRLLNYTLLASFAMMSFVTLPKDKKDLYDTDIFESEENTIGKQ